MKRLTRREFLKLTGVTVAGAGLALITDGCQPIGSGGIPVRATDTPIPPPGTNYKVPACCSYDSLYRYEVTQAPSRPVYGEVARELGAAIDYLNDPANMPNGASPDDLSRDTVFVVNAVQNCLGFSIDSLFMGDTHSARNGLASVAELITYYFGGYLALYLPDAPPDQLNKKNFYDENKDEDLWDGIYVLASPPEGIPVTPDRTGSAGIRAFTGEKQDLLSIWLNKLADIADKLELWNIFGEDKRVCNEEVLVIWGQFVKEKAKCPDTSNFPADSPAKYCPEINITQATREGLAAMGYSYNDPTTYNGVITSLMSDFGPASEALTNALNAPADQQDSTVCEAILLEMSQYILGMKLALFDFTKVIDAALVEAAAIEAELARQRAEKRQSCVDGASKIWEVIGGCAMAAIPGKFEDSLHAWCGSKKYIVAGGCALLQVPVLIGTGLAGIPVAIEGFIYCFIQGMIGTTWSVAYDITVCLIGEAFDDD